MQNINTNTEIKKVLNMGASSNFYNWVRRKLTRTYWSVKLGTQPGNHMTYFTQFNKPSHNKNIKKTNK